MRHKATRLALIAALAAAVTIGGVFYGVLQIITDTSEDW